MNPTANLPALESLLKVLRRGILQLSKDYQTVSDDIKARRLAHNRQGKRDGVGRLTMTRLRETQRELHQLLSDLVRGRRNLQIRVMQAKRGLIFSSLEAAASPLLVSLMEMALTRSTEQLPTTHALWRVPLDAKLLMSAEIELIARISGRGCGQMWEILNSHRNRHILLTLEGGTLWAVRSQLQVLLAATAETPIQEITSASTSRREQFNALRRRLQETLKPEEYGLLKEFGQYF